jgi:antitoxin component YwqK of YwqJK toxin-antitoxin module
MKKLLALFPLLLIQLAYAQNYKELNREDIKIVMSDDKRSVNIAIVTKDNTPLPTGYYVAPFNKANEQISFYVGPDGKLGKTAKLIDQESYSLIPMENGKANGKATVFEKNRLIKEIIFEHGIIRSSKAFNGHKLTEEVHDSKGELLSTKEFENNQLVSVTTFENNTFIEQQFEKGTLVAAHNSKTNQYFTYHPNGKIKTSSAVINDKKVEKEFSISGTLTSEKTTTFEPYGLLTKWYHLNGQLRKIEEENSTQIKFKEYSATGKLIKSGVKAAEPTITISN